MKRIVLAIMLTLIGAHAAESSCMQRSTQSTFLRGARAGLNPFIAQPRFQPKLNSLVSKATTPALNQINSRLFSSTASTYDFFGTTAMKKPETVVSIKDPKTGKKIILIADHHFPNCKGNGCSKQQKDLIDLISWFKQQGETVEVIIEDAMSFQEKNNVDIDARYPILKKLGEFKTPLTFLAKSLQKNNISYKNLEFRGLDVEHSLKTIERINKETNPNILKALSNINTSLVGKMGFMDLFEGTLLNADVYNETIKSNASVVIICAGGLHAAAVAKLFYKDGYTETQAIIPATLNETNKRLITDFDKDEPITCPTEFPNAYLDNLKDSVIEGWKKFTPPTKIRPNGYLSDLKNRIVAWFKK